MLHFTNPTTQETGQWTILVSDANNYTLDQPVNGSTYSPQAGDSVFASLVTAQCCFSPTTVTPYMSKCYVQMANIMAAGGLTPWLQFGEILHWFFSYAHGIPITAFYNSGGFVAVQTELPVNVGSSGNVPVILAGTGFCDGTQYATIIDNFNVLTAVAWPGAAPTPKGTITGGGMGLYDVNQQTAYGALPLYFTQDDSIAGDAAAVTFLQQRIDTHIRAIRTAVIAAQGGAKFEILYPTDVTAATCYYTNDFPYPQGGVLNNAINLPASWHTKAGSPFDRWKTEALSWQSFYFNFDNFLAMVAYPTTTLGWAKADTAILIGWNYGGAPWAMAYLYALNGTVPLVNFWAVDHDSEFSWPALMPGNQPSVGEL